MAFVFGGLWLLHVASRSGKAPVWLLAGLTIGGASLARVDGFLYLAPVLLALALAARVAAPEARSSMRRGMAWCVGRSEEHTSELQSLMRISYAVFCLTQKNTAYKKYYHINKT